MIIGNAKVYFDGSHYIAIPQTTTKAKKKASISSTKAKKLREDFEVAYKEIKGKRKSEKVKYIKERLKDKFDDEGKLKQYIDENMARKTKNAIYRRKRFVRKLYLYRWDYFVTFTYDSNKLSEEEFKTKLKNCFKYLTHSKHWKYLGVWERATASNRLHFHGVFQIPKDCMIGKLMEVTDYDTRSHKKRTTTQNTYFLARFGRNDFSEIINCAPAMSVVARYLIKYLEKSGEKIVSSRNVKASFYSDIMDKDVLAAVGEADKNLKLILADDFICLDEGCYMGKVSPEVIDRMRKANV